MLTVTFKKEKNNFFDELKWKIDLYFSSNKISRSGNYKIYIKSIVFMLAAALSYIALLFFTPAPWISVFLCVLLGVALAGIGFNIMHDSAHGSYSTKRWVNKALSYSLNLLGGNIFIWENKHNFNHHNFTNIDGMDDDIDIEPWIRTHTNQPRRRYHRYQHIYGLALYGITYIYWVFAGDFKKYFRKKIGNTDLAPMDLKEHVIFWGSKALYISLFLIIPMVKIGFWATIIGYSITAFVAGFILGVVFQLAHLIEVAQFPMPMENSNKMEQNWALHQIATTVNFATNNKAIFWFTGGLNFQAVHHIFPKICHIHYPQINALIRETCDKYAIKYNEYPTFWSTVRSHLAYLKSMGSI